MEIFYDGGDAGLEEAVELFSQYFQEGEFWDELLKLGPFTHTNVKVDEIVGYMRSCPNNLDLVHFTPQTAKDKKKYKKTVAYVDGGHPFKMFYHTKFLGNSVSRKVNTLFHEFVHVVDLFADSSPSWNYGHAVFGGGAKLKSAPYQIGRAAQKYHNGGKKRGLGRDVLFCGTEDLATVSG